MENMRMKMKRDGFMDIQPLGGSRLGRGIISENLGCTDFKWSSDPGQGSSELLCRAPSTKDNSHGNSSEDELDALSSSLRFSPSPLSASKRSRPQKQKCQPSAMVTHETTFDLRPKPKPRPNYRDAKSLDTGRESTATSLQSRTLRSRLDDHGTSTLQEFSPNREMRYKTITRKRGTRSSRIQNNCHASKSGLKKRSLLRARTDLAPFPLASPSPKRSSLRPLPAPCSTPSPLRTQRLLVRESMKTTCRIPQLFPLDNPSYNSPTNGEDNDMDELALTDSDSDAILTYGGPRPFPMTTSQNSVKPKTELPALKRFSNNCDMLTENESFRSSLGSSSFNSSVDGGETVDPSTICPYCDEPWPSVPSATLVALLERTERKSYLDPRPGNALGLKAPLAVFVELCQRHRFEMTHLPLALERGWPTRLDFVSLPKRIKRFKRQLQRFAMHPDESQFWREVRNDIRKVGKTKLVSLSGQYATFQRTQPGYYGEQGSIIIHQSLYSMFPPDSIMLASIDPLTLDQFLTLILVPETAILLIREDMRLSSKEEALLVLNESKEYGLAMFPEQAQGEEAAEVGEQLARERAKERRKILEERGETDATMNTRVDREPRMTTTAQKIVSDRSDSKGRRGRKESDIERVVRIGGQPAPRLLIAAETPRTSFTSWRSRLLSSTSPPSCSESPRASQSSSPRKKDAQWIFDLQNVTPSPDCEDIYSSEANANVEAPEWASSDSRVVNFENNNNLTMTPKPTLNDKDDSSVWDAIVEDATPKARTRPRLKPATNKNENQYLACDYGAVVLGQTKRKGRERGRNI